MLPVLKSSFFGPQDDMYSNLEKDTKILRSRLELSLDTLSDAFSQVKDYQSEIEEASDFWKLTFDAVDSPIAILDANSKLLNGNKAFVTAVGLQIKDFLNKSICKVFCGTEEDLFSPCMKCCAQDYVYKNDRLYKIKFNKIIDSENILKGCVFVAHDITEEQKMQEYLSETTAKYMGIFNAAYDAIILADIDSKKIIEANPGAVRIYGYRLKDFYDMNLLDLTAEPEKTLEVLNTREEKVPLRFHKRRDGTIIPVEISSSYYIYDNKNYVVSIIRDISDKISNEALNQCIQKLLLS